MTTDNKSKIILCIQLSSKTFRAACLSIQSPVPVALVFSIHKTESILQTNGSFVFLSQCTNLSSSPVYNRHLCNTLLFETQSTSNYHILQATHYKPVRGEWMADGETTACRMSDFGSKPDSASVVDVHWFNTVEFVDKLNVRSLTPESHNILKP